MNKDIWYSFFDLKNSVKFVKIQKKNTVLKANPNQIEWYIWRSLNALFEKKQAQIFCVNNFWRFNQTSSKQCFTFC